MEILKIAGYTTLVIGLGIVIYSFSLSRDIKNAKTTDEKFEAVNNGFISVLGVIFIIVGLILSNTFTTIE